MASAENWEIRAFLHAEGSVDPLYTVTSGKKMVSKEQALKEVVKMLNGDDDFGDMVELLKEPLLIDPNKSTLLPTAYEFESTIPADGIFPAIDPSDL